MQTTPSRKLPYGRYGSQQLSLESLQNSPGSSLMGASCTLRGAHSMPLPMHAQPSPQGPRPAPPAQVCTSAQPAHPCLHRSPCSAPKVSSQPQHHVPQQGQTCTPKECWEGPA